MLVNKEIVMKIKIDGLFGKYTSVVDLSNRCNIIIGENGVGKSTTLKIIYCILNMDFIEITKYNFEIITIEDEKFELEEELNLIKQLFVD